MKTNVHLFPGNIVAKLRKMDEIQRIYDENLMNQMLSKRKLKKINLYENSVYVESTISYKYSNIDSP